MWLNPSVNYTAFCLGNWRIPDHGHHAEPRIMPSPFIHPHSFRRWAPGSTRRRAGSTEHWCSRPPSSARVSSGSLRSAPPWCGAWRHISTIDAYSSGLKFVSVITLSKSSSAFSEVRSSSIRVHQWGRACAPGVSRAAGVSSIWPCVPAFEPASQIHRDGPDRSSRDAVLALTEALDVSLRERNASWSRPALRASFAKRR
jgi:hypothetical protein